MKAFVVCLFDWDYRCDCDVMRELLAVFGTLEQAVEYSLSFPIQSQDDQVEIVEMEGSVECGRYAQNGKKMDY